MAATYRFYLGVLILLLISSTAGARTGRGRSLSFSLSGGTANFTVLSPSDMQLNKGFNLSLECEKPFVFFGLYLE
jgi:hypothetical protein